jgi:IS5 family transposase
MQPKNPSKILPLFQADLNQCLNHKHPLVVLAKEIDWPVFEKAFKSFYSEDMGRPAKMIRLMVGLHYLKHAFSESDESVVDRWVENPYWQFFCGYETFQTKMPVVASNLSQWRKRIGPEKMEELLKQVLETGKKKKLIKRSDLERVNVDTTVQEKNITYPTDAKLYHKMREVLVREAKKRRIVLRQTYSRLSKRALVMQARYRHSRKAKQARRELRKIKRYLTRVVRDLIGKVDPRDESMKEKLFQAARLLRQEKDSKNKIYSIHAPEVECIAKGKVHKKYEFGCKVGIVSSSRSNWVLGIQAFHPCPYDGHTLSASLEQAERMTGRKIKKAYVDLGYRGHGYEGPTEVHVVGRSSFRGLSRTERRYMRRRAAVEPVISHVKHDNRMDRNFLLGVDGDEINAILAGAGLNFRKLMEAVKRLFLRLFYARFGVFFGSRTPQIPFRMLLPPISAHILATEFQGDRVPAAA